MIIATPTEEVKSNTYEDMGFWKPGYISNSYLWLLSKTFPETLPSFSVPQIKSCNTYTLREEVPELSLCKM